MKTLYPLILCLFIFSLQAQNYYYNGSEKVNFSNSETSFISFDNPSKIRTITNDFQKVETFSQKGFTILNQKKSSFSKQKFQVNNLNQTIPALRLQEDEIFLLYPTKTIRIKLKPNSKIDDLVSLLDNNEVVKIEDKYGVIEIEIKDIHKVIEMANKLYEYGIAEFSIPDFYIPVELNQVNDPLFPLQFQMHNTGQVIDGIAGVDDIDCNALEAWDVSLGNNVTVAIIDQGLEAHEDIGDRLIGGFSPGINGDGTPLTNDATHGMNCAGIVGASDNNLGVRGVAPNVDFLSVNIFDGGTVSDIADGIQWAIDNGADVLSNSWSFDEVPCGFTNIDIENTLQNAVDNGRNGDGAVIVFSAGNTGGCVNYPASNENVISVGAVDNRGNLYNYSSRGLELDLVAPSGLRFGGVGVRTLDRMGNAGDFPGNYRDNFDGTSAACPVVSGTAALVLSLNPNLTQQEVRDILTSTATDMGAVGFDNNFGFGRVNAFAAVQEAVASLTPILTGPSLVCTSNTSFTLSGVPSGQTVSWSVSPRLSLVSSNATGATVRAVSASTSGSATLTATLSNGVEVAQVVWVGSPGAITELSHPTTFGCTKGELDVMSSGGQHQYQWVISGGKIVIPSINTNTYTGNGVIFVEPTGTQRIRVRVRAINSCGESGWHTVYIPVNCPYGGEGGATPLIAIFDLLPNPTKGLFTLHTHRIDKHSAQTTVQLTVYDLHGQVRLQQSVSPGSSIDSSQLKAGMYLVQIQHAHGQETHQLVVE